MLLVGLREIADICEVLSSVSNWKVREVSFTKPVYEIKAEPIFNLYEIEQWILQKGKNTAN
ncbi:hypothetical protein [Clostridium perfringens]|uniref:hypothetical protein n=1 Tax=Clostridium perfringens TaxID=1502 RepID=UPI003A0FBD2F